MSRAWILALAVLAACGGGGASGPPGGGGGAKDATGADVGDADPTDSTGGSGATDGVEADAGPTLDVAGTDTGGTADAGGTDASDTGSLPDIGGTDAAGVDAAAPDVGGDTSDTAEDIREEADTEEPGACETDDECQLLTDKSCCPAEQDPCGGEPEVGSQSDQDQIIGWIAQNCDPSDPCDPVDPPACDDCHVLETLTPVCDPETKKCAVAKSLDCEALCAAWASPPVGACPKLSDPSLLTSDNADDCGCP